MGWWNAIWRGEKRKKKPRPVIHQAGLFLRNLAYFHFAR
jgi:hypothetical protein